MDNTNHNQKWDYAINRMKHHNDGWKELSSGEGRYMELSEAHSEAEADVVCYLLGWLGGQYEGREGVRSIEWLQREMSSEEPDVAYGEDAVTEFVIDRRNKTQPPNWDTDIVPDEPDDLGIENWDYWYRVSDKLYFTVTVRKTTFTPDHQYKECYFV